MTDIKDFIVEYIEDNASTEGALINDETNFVETGLLDSFAILGLIMTLESQYSIKFEPRELADPALRIVGTLAQIIASKMSLNDG